jgi:catechol 2,3-dioxygenase-like lactoylglutathione lyase family enzyme
VPVDDQERAKKFWGDRLGFELRRDVSAQARSAAPDGSEGGVSVPRDSAPTARRGRRKDSEMQAKCP